MLRKIYYSLPIQLLIVNLKRNRVILLIWLLLFTIITGNFGRSYGVPYLLLDPEYLLHVDFFSLLLVGFAFGIFFIAYNITLYILESYRFQFLMLKRNPFPRFCLNNFIIPLSFIISYVVCFYKFQVEFGKQPISDILIEILGFFSGMLVTITFSMFYFRITGYVLFKKFTENLNNTLKTQKIARVGIIQKLKIAKKKSYHSDYFLDFPLKIVRVDSFLPLDKELISKVIDRYHINALLLQIVGFVFIIILGYFKDNLYFQIPAGASILILVSIIIMLMGFFNFWIKSWSLYVVASIILITNYAIQFHYLNPIYEVFGLNYNAPKAEYSNQELRRYTSKSLVDADIDSMKVVLDKWKARQGSSKPKIVFLCTSGGGQRAASWALRSLQVGDSITQNALFRSTFLITGASGGLIGAAYYRELAARENTNRFEKNYFNNITKDILNPVVFSLIVNDIFVRFETFSDGKYTYIKDRGYAFEKQLNINTEGILNKKVVDYQALEHNAKIPLMLLTPSVVNDGRKLYISTQKLSFMNGGLCLSNKDIALKVKGVEFMRFFEKQDAQNLGFLSALRMSATFPYITPNVNLPSSPAMEVMDAGLTDNYGVIDAVRFTHVFRDWINENTSGVVFLSIRDSPKIVPIKKQSSSSLFDRIFNPIGSLYANWDWIQDNNDEYFIEYANTFLDKKVDFIELQYSPSPETNAKQQVDSVNISDEYVQKSWTQRASLNWHLTTKEKQNIYSTIYTYQNWKALQKLNSILDSKK